ncbi:MAG: flagellar basal body-associated FliL family protein [Desulfobacteraceae bacterium]|nr:flagellar basal body-associated FliL family protein [Desulfobacteraceae bacterium]
MNPWTIQSVPGRLFVAIVAGLLLFACGRSEPTAGERLLGSWRAQTRNIHTILNFRANGTWTSQVRIEGSLSRIVQKKGTVAGTWEVNPEGRLLMTATETPIAIGWEQGQPVSFEIVALTDALLQLDDHAGRKLALERVKIQHPTGGSRFVTVDLDPIVVNLRTSIPNEPPRFVCVSIGLVLAADRGAAMTPKVREAVIFHLGGLTYAEVSTQEALEALKNDLQHLVNLYLGGTVSELHIKRMVVTTQQRVVDEFLQKVESTGKDRPVEKTAG